jgi:integrase
MALCRRGAVWHYDFWLQGRRYRGSTREMSRARAAKVQALLVLEAKDKRSLLRFSKVPVLSQFSHRFFDWVKVSQLAATTKQYYQYGWNMLKKTRIPGMPLDQITRDTAEMLRFHGSPANGNAALRTLRRMLAKATEWGILQAPPRIKLLKEQGREIIIGPETEAKLLAAAKQPLRDVIVIMQDTGMRPQDVFRLRWEHVNWQKRTVFVPYGKTKNSRRYVPMSERVVEVLVSRAKGSSEWVFPSRRSKTGHLTTVANQFRQARQDVGLDPAVKLYCCRHTFATDVLERTGNLAALMKVLGHADAQTAMKYQHPGLEQIRKAVEERNREHAALAARSAESPHKSPHSGEWVQ